MSLKKAAAGLAVLGCLVVACAAGQEILFPKMTPEKGTFDEPAGKLGKKPTTPWSATTLAAYRAASREQWAADEMIQFAQMSTEARFPSFRFARLMAQEARAA